MKRKIGFLFSIAGKALYFIFGLWGLIIALDILNYVGGFFLVVAGFMFFPITLIAAPFYALVEFNTFYPLLVIYGGGILASFLMMIGEGLKE